MQNSPLEGSHWLQQAYNEHHLLVDGHWQATLQLKMLWTGKHKAKAQIGEDHYTFEPVGQWKRRILINDDHGDTVGEMVQPKWYASNLEIHYKERTYKIQSKNNPLVEYGLYQGDIPLLRYGLSLEGASVKLYRKASRHEVPLLLEVALWYLFPAKMGYAVGWSDAAMLY